MEQMNQDLLDKVKAEAKRHAKRLEKLGIPYIETGVCKEADQAFIEIHAHGLEVAVLVAGLIRETLRIYCDATGCSEAEAEIAILRIISREYEKIRR